MYSENIKCSEECAVEKSSVYLSLIDECFSVANRINREISLISQSNVPTKAQTSTPSRTELESRLKSLLEKLEEISNSIVY